MLANPYTTNLKWECHRRSSEHSHLVVDFSVVCQPPTPTSGKYQVFPLPANLQHLRLENISDFRCQPTKANAFLTYIIYRITSKNNIQLLQKYDK
jgi:hypothetical protein